MKLILACFLLVVVLVSACNPGNGPTGATVADVATDSCDDSNLCTQDSKVNGQCASKPIIPCCGNNICEADENCDKDCLSGVLIKDYRCDGKCERTDDIIKIRGDSSILFNIANEGKQDEKVRLGYGCTRLKGGSIVFENYGLKTRTSFEGKDEVILPAKSVVEYNVKFEGKPTIRTELTCSLQVEGKQSILEVFYVLLEP